MRHAVAKARKAARKVLIRHALACMVLAAIVVFAVEPWLVSGTTPLIASLAVAERVNFYNQVIIVSAALLGFILTAITILVSLDTGRKIVKELHYGEAFKLLIVNMLAAVCLLAIVTTLGIAGSVLDAGFIASRTFETFYEWLVLASAAELGLTGFYFALATYKVAAYE